MFPIIAPMRSTVFFLIFMTNNTAPISSDNISKGVVSKPSATNLATNVKEFVWIVAAHELTSLFTPAKFALKRAISKKPIRQTSKVVIVSWFFLISIFHETLQTVINFLMQGYLAFSPLTRIIVTRIVDDAKCLGRSRVLSKFTSFY
jgi:hypothetical protein